MYLCLVGHGYRYELEKIARIFFPFEKIEFTDEEKCSGFSAVTRVSENNNKRTAEAELYCDGNVISESLCIEENADDMKREEELKLALTLYACFSRLTNYRSQWGILTGIRPAKLFSKFSDLYGKEYAENYFRESFLVDEKKTELCKEAVAGENAIVALSGKKSVSLYISVPFCPSRCSYCSFVSHSTEQSRHLIPEYVRLLCEEIKTTGEITKSLGLKLETVYIGGGTPTTLSAEQLETVMKTVACVFDLSTLREYTVEAGRPDTITAEKLRAIKDGGATRISINPQTMNDAVLSHIGRRHTAQQTEEAFLLARSEGFGNINTDLIAGLPTDTFESFKQTLERVLRLDPESVTVHSLSMKRSSRLTSGGCFPEIEMGKTASLMVDYAHEALRQNGIYPYYMYRQSKTVGNLENVGYSKKGYECLYNVYIMDETHSIFACGASAVTKLRQPGGEQIERIFNFKYPYEYINRYDEIIERKSGITDFYKKYL